MADILKPYEVLYDFSDVPTIKKFALDDSRVRNIMGPFGCIAGDSLVITAQGLLRISDIDHPMHVLTWNAKKDQFQLSLSGGAFPKKIGNLYRIVTESGEFHADEHHRVLSASGEYLFVSDLKVGDLLASHFQTLKDSIADTGQIGKKLNVQNCSQIDIDSLENYANEARQYGQQFLLGEDISPDVAPLPVDVRESFRSSFYTDVYQEQVLTHTPHRLTDDHVSTPENHIPSEGLLEGSEEGLVLTQSLQRNSKGMDSREYRSSVSESLLKSESRRLTNEGLLVSDLSRREFLSSCNTSLMEYTTIIHIEMIKGKHLFWDMQILGTNNYVTVDGTIHHNSGKSSGCVMEIIRRSNLQRPGPDGIRRSRWAIVRNCYDDQTEVLTETRGWQLFRDLVPEDCVATLDGDTLVYKQPSGVATYFYRGEMIGFESEGVDFLVTPDHKMWVSKRRTRKKIWGDYEVLTAKEIYGSQLVRVRRDADWQGTEVDLSCFVYEWLGLWFAEGSYGVYKGEERITLTQCNEDGILYARALANRAGLQCLEWKRKEGINFVLKNNSVVSERVVSLVKNAGKAREKKIPQEILHAPKSHLQAFLRGMVFGDGNTYRGTTRILIGSKCMADDLQEIALKAGYVANVRTTCDNTGRGVFFNGIRKGQTNGPTYGITLLRPWKYHPILKVDPKTTNKLRGWYKEQYDGNVYCVEMPLVPVYVRRNGKAFWCMRTYNQLRDTTIKTFHDWFPPKIFGEWRVTDHVYIMTKFPNVHLEVLFRALDRPDQVSNLLSLELTGAWFNEVREIPMTLIDAMDSRIGRYPSKRDGGASWYGMIFDTNPPDEDSSLYDRFEKIKPDNWKIFKQPSGLSTHAENTKHLPKNYYKNLAKGKSEMYQRIYIHGQYGYIVSGKPVFTSFVDNVHVAPNILEPIKGIDLIMGYDFGLQPACCIGQLTPLGQLRILDELVSDGMGLRQFCENQLLPLLRKKYFGMNVMGYGDPSGTSRSPTDESTCFDILHSKDIGLTDIIPAETNAIMPRVGAVENFLNKMYKGEPGFILSPNCHFLRKAMNGGYHYEKEPKSLEQEYKPMPTKNFSSHIADSLEMLCLYLEDKTGRDQRHKSFLAQIKRHEYRPASDTAGY